MRPSIRLSLSILAIGALAFGPVAVDPDAEESCTVIRGAETQEDPDDDVSACRQDVWFHGAGVPADNLDNAQGAFAAWDTTPPSASVTEGAGNGVLVNSALHQQASPFDEREAFVAAGSFDGAIEDLVVELYLFTPGTNVDDPQNPVVRGDYSVDAQLEVDGYVVQTLADHVVTLESAGDAVQRITFAFRGLSDTIELIGELDATHDVEVRVHGTAIVSDAAIMVYDTTEVPAGMVFNPPTEVLDELS